MYFHNSTVPGRFLPPPGSSRWRTEGIDVSMPGRFLPPPGSSRWRTDKIGNRRSLSRSQLLPCFFAMLELFVAMAMLALVASCLIGGLAQLRRLHQRCLYEHQAVLVLDNTVERLNAIPGPDSATIEAVFNDEFKKSGLAERPQLYPIVTKNGTGLRLGIKTKNRTLGEIRMDQPLQKRTSPSSSGSIPPKEK